MRARPLPLPVPMDGWIGWQQQQQPTGLVGLLVASYQPRPCDLHTQVAAPSVAGKGSLGKIPKALKK